MFKHNYTERVGYLHSSMTFISSPMLYYIVIHTRLHILYYVCGIHRLENQQTDNQLQNLFHYLIINQLILPMQINKRDICAVFLLTYSMTNKLVMHIGNIIHVSLRFLYSFFTVSVKFLYRFFRRSLQFLYSFCTVSFAFYFQFRYTLFIVYLQSLLLQS